MGRSDFYTGIILLGFGVTVFVGSMSYSFGNITSPGAGFVPRLAALILVMMSGFIVIKSFFKEKGDVIKEVFFSKKESYLRMGVALGSFLLYRLLFPVLGFLPTNFLFFLIATRSLGNFSWKFSIFFSLLTTAGGYLLFGVCLKIAMPPSFWGM